MEWIKCPACGKKIKGLRSHYRSSHPDLDIPDLRNPAPPPAGLAQPQEPLTQVPPQETLSQESSVESSPPEAPQSNVLQKLKAFGIDPNDIMLAFTPLIETSVVKTLEKMQLGEAINKKIAEVETKVGERIKPLTDLAAQAQGQMSNNGGEVAGAPGAASERNAVMDTILAGIAQKLLNPNSGGSNSLEQLTKILDMARAVSDAFNKPIWEAQAATRRDINETLKLMRNAGATPEAATKVLIDRTED